MGPAALKTHSSLGPNSEKVYETQNADYRNNVQYSSYIEGKNCFSMEYNKGKK